jgi:hypothetical protein
MMVVAAQERPLIKQRDRRVGEGRHFYSKGIQQSGRGITTCTKVRLRTAALKKGEQSDCTSCWSGLLVASPTSRCKHTENTCVKHLLINDLLV